MRKRILTTILMIAAAATPARTAADISARAEKTRQAPEADWYLIEQKWSGINEQLRSYWETSFRNRLKTAAPEQRETLMKIHSDQQKAEQQVETMDNTAQQQARAEAEMKDFIAAERTFEKSLEGKSVAEREKEIKTHRALRHRKSAKSKIKELEAEMAAKMTAREKAFIKNLDQESPPERDEAVRANLELRDLEEEAYKKLLKMEKGTQH